MIVKETLVRMKNLMGLIVESDDDNTIYSDYTFKKLNVVEHDKINRVFFTDSKPIGNDTLK